MAAAAGNAREKATKDESFGGTLRQCLVVGKIAAKFGARKRV